jgi:hypothetical protein
MRANQETLVAVARRHGKAVASSWRAYRDNDSGAVLVWHYDTLMLEIDDDNTVRGISGGWGSMTDKCGIRKILTNVNGQGYRQIFG